MRLLVISNGHGEDIIAVRIIEQLQNLIDDLEIFSLPLVGEGYAYGKAGIPLAGKVQNMPSGGFVYMSQKQFLSDLRGGLIGLTLEQLKVAREWGKTKYPILAVGDIVPLLFAFISKSNYAFVGTAKSEYYLRDSQGAWLAKTSWLERQFDSVYLPWERWLMSRGVKVYPRDSLTTEVLQRQGIEAFDGGNPMMDGFTLETSPEIVDKTLKILLLPGSRSAEALRNWQQILTTVSEIIEQFPDYNLIFYTAIAPALDILPFRDCSISDGWQLKSQAEKMLFHKRQATLWLAQNAYGEYLHQTNLAIAMAGTATEQFVGLGKPVITMPGKGPQCTDAFMEAQSRLLGCSILLRDRPNQVVEAVKLLLNSPELRREIVHNGRERMGKPGAAFRIARDLQQTLLLNCS